MRLFPQSVLAVSLLAALLLMPGCDSPSYHDEAVSAAGTVEFVNNSLQVFDRLPFSDVWSAALAALPAMQLPVTVTRKDLNYGRLDGRDAQNHAIVIQLVRKHRHLTEIRITVGTPGASDNRTEAKDIYDHIKAKY